MSKTVGPISLTYERACLALAASCGVPWTVETMPGMHATTLHALEGRYALDGNIVVSCEHSAMTVFGSPAANYAFRAWHDSVHLRYARQFDWEGEHGVHYVQNRELEDWLARHCADYSERLRCLALLECENIGQLQHWRRYGAPPEDQRTFALGWLAAKGLI